VSRCCRQGIISQFLHSRTNVRTDAYGGSTENRGRLVFDALDAVSDRIDIGWKARPDGQSAPRKRLQRLMRDAGARRASVSDQTEANEVWLTAAQRRWAYLIVNGEVWMFGQATRCCGHYVPGILTRVAGISTASRVWTGEVLGGLASSGPKLVPSSA
jgi:hypothetical protein